MTEDKYKRNLKKIQVLRNYEPSFDKACEAALRDAVRNFGIDDDGNSRSGIDWVRSTDSIGVKFESLEMMTGMIGQEYIYEFSIWTTRFDDDGDLVEEIIDEND